MTNGFSPILGFVLLGAISVVIVACGEETPELVATADRTTPPVPAPQATVPPLPTTTLRAESFNIGDTVQLGDLQITVHGVRAGLGDRFWIPREGHYYVYVDVGFRNTGTESHVVSSLLQIELRDIDGFSYSIDLGATAAAEKSSPDGEIAPGGILRGEIGYQIPITARGLTWHFSGELFLLGQAIFSLGTVAVPTTNSVLTLKSATTAEPTLTPSSESPTTTPAPTNTSTPPPSGSATATPTIKLTPTQTPTDIPTPEPAAQPKTATPELIATPESISSPRSGFDPGTYQVSSEIRPGVYAGKAGIGLLDSCYWERLSGASGAFSDLIANGNAVGQFYVEILSTDKYFKINCHITHLSSWPEPEASLSNIQPGTYLVGRDISVGTYRGEAGTGPLESCYWERLSGVSGEFSDLVANDIAIGPYFVDIKGSDYALSTACALELVE